MSQLQVNAGQYSVAGVKEDNQDSLGIRIPSEPALTSKGIAVAIADGMSACHSGREASEASVCGFLNDYYSTPDSWTVKTSAQKILTALNQWLFSKGHAIGDGQYGLVTTLSIVVLKSNTAHLFHVGDSRIYRLREGIFECLTRDHRIWVSADKNYLNRALGVDLHLDIDYKTEVVEVGDCFLLTTDGIHDYLNDATIEAFIKQPFSDLDEAAKLLVDKALAAKSLDNVSCQIVQIEALPHQDVAEAFQHLVELPIPPVLEPGHILDGYKVLRELHASSRSQLYLALDTETNEQVALKTPSVNFDDDEAYLDAFLHEDWVGKRLNNPHIMKIHPQTRKKQFLYIVSEFLEGQSLRQWMRDNPVPDLSDIRNILEQIDRGLRAFHRLEMLHQDLKPENIMIDKYGVVKIIDFGSVKIAGIEEQHTPLERHHLMGTYDYCAPEYLTGKPGSFQSDLYSVGVIIYEMLAGELPYSSSGLLKQSNREYISVLKHNEALPVWVDGALRKALQIDSELRYQEMSEFVYDMQHPNEALVASGYVPLIVRNPVGFWRWTSALLLISNVFLLVQWLK
jgi:eukaryotic-like serine/threonine-protein kinase